MKSIWKTDTTAIANCLTKCSNEQRQKIAAHYMLTHQKSLTEDLDKMLSGCMERLTLALMRPPFLFLSMEVHDALSAVYVDERVLVEILCTKTSVEIKQINEAYKRGELKL